MAFARDVPAVVEGGAAGEVVGEDEGEEDQHGGEEVGHGEEADPAADACVGCVAEKARVVGVEGGSAFGASVFGEAAKVVAAVEAVEEIGVGMRHGGIVPHRDIDGDWRWYRFQKNYFDCGAERVGG